MAKADQIKALVKSHTEGDNERFYSVALQVAAQAARSGHHQVAQELRDLIDDSKNQSRSNNLHNMVPIAQPKGELEGVLSVSYPSNKLTDMVLEPTLLGRLQRVVREQKQRGRLKEHGFLPLSKLLFIGPPGVGKTMSASALAGELKLPLFTVQIDGLITKFMGETAAKLRLVFDAMVVTRGVYFFDEFDALGGHRNSSNDVGEIRRVLNSFLQFIERDQSESIIIGATNYVELLDHALFRRFDDIFEYLLPNKDIVHEIMLARLFSLDTTRVKWSEVLDSIDGLSHAEITRACEQAAKGALLDDRKYLTTNDLVDALRERHILRR